MPTSHRRVLCGVFCPTREEFCGAGIVEIAANLAVLQFNNRAKAVAKVVEEMGCSTRFYMETACVWGREEERRSGGEERRPEKSR